MAIVAGLLGLTFAAMHGAAVPAMRSEARIPPWARVLWAGLVLVTAVGAVLVLVESTFAVVTVGVAGLVVLAVANGVWLHGRPTWSHHAVRLTLGVVVIALSVAAS